jgi:hypothetical protein
MIILNLLRDALTSIPSGLRLLMLVGILYGLENLGLLPLELGFAGSAALVIAAYVVVRDLMKPPSGQRGSDFTTANTAAAAMPAGTATLPRVAGSRATTAMITVVAVSIFAAASLVYRAKMDARQAQVANCASENEIQRQLRGLTPDQ